MTFASNANVCCNAVMEAAPLRTAWQRSATGPFATGDTAPFSSLRARRPHFPPVVFEDSAVAEPKPVSTCGRAPFKDLLHTAEVDYSVDGDARAQDYFVVAGSGLKCDDSVQSDLGLRSRHAWTQLESCSADSRTDRLSRHNSRDARSAPRNLVARGQVLQ